MKFWRTPTAIDSSENAERYAARILMGKNIRQSNHKVQETLSIQVFKEILKEVILKEEILKGEALKEVILKEEILNVLLKVVPCTETLKLKHYMMKFLNFHGMKYL